MLAIISVLPVLFFVAMALCGPRQSPFFHSKLAQWINARYGPHTFESFLVRLKPLLMFGTAGALQGVIGLWHGRHVKPADDIASGFLLSAGVGFAVAHVILYLRRAVAVFPTWAIAQPVPKPAHKTLRDALRVYWWALIGVGIFPAIFVAGGELLGIPFEVFILPFFAVSFLAGWPHLSGRAPYSFWLVAMCVWLGGGIFAVVLLQLLRVMTGLTPQ
jgi:hypothetical protein